LKLREEAGLPKGKQVVEQFRDLIRDGALKPGERLPSTRRLADQLGLHRSTVAQAYQALWALGWVDLRPGALPRVRQREALVQARSPRETPFPWAERLALGPAPLSAPALPEGAINFMDFGMDPRLMPLEPFTRSLRAALRRQGRQLLQYGHPQGEPGLREVLAQRLGQHGIQAAPEDVLVTLGSQQALDLAVRVLARPGASVVVEAPTYNQMLRLLEFQGVRALPMPEDLDALDTLVRRERPALLYLMPSFQNPTGRSLPQTRREAMLALCERRGLPILEDGFTEEMKYFGRPMLPMKSMDRTGLVLYAGTFSKVLFPGLRLGRFKGALT
jgi:DNA-binding transcriptional MocR family regulator